ncbi:membrane protein [Streptomyces flavofungini]|nr:membrane protein [Streptomyces flavofungini]
MKSSWTRKAMRGVLAAAVCAVPLTLSTGTAHADETHHSGSHTAPVIGLINTGQIDDPLEDVLEHTLNFGDGYRWD